MEALNGGRKGRRSWAPKGAKAAPKRALGHCATRPARPKEYDRAIDEGPYQPLQIEDYDFYPGALSRQARLRREGGERGLGASARRSYSRARLERVRLVSEGRFVAADRAGACRPIARARHGRGQSAEVHRCARRDRVALSHRRHARDDDRPRVPRATLVGFEYLALGCVLAPLLGAHDGGERFRAPLHGLADLALPLHEEREPAHAPFVRARA